jgi:hypothetical protein
MTKKSSHRERKEVARNAIEKRTMQRRNTKALFALNLVDQLEARNEPGDFSQAAIRFVREATQRE